MGKWLKSFSQSGIILFVFLGIIGTIALIASAVFTIIGTGTLTVQREPLVWLGVSIALYSLALGCLSIYLSNKKTIAAPGGETMTSDDAINVDSILGNLVKKYEDQLVKVYLDKKGEIPVLISKELDVENLSLVFTLKKTANLVKGTEKLTRLTKWLFGVTVLLFIAAIIQIVASYQLSNVISALSQ